MKHNKKTIKRKDPIDSLMNEMMNFRGFGNMDNMMDNFFQDDDDDFFNDFNDFGFSKKKKNKSKKNEIGMKNNFGGGNFYSKQVVISSHQGPDGKMHQKHYVDNQYNIIGKDGKKFGERNQMYKNTKDNINKLTQDKYYDNKGVRLKKERNGNELMEERIFKGMEENEFDNFKNDWQRKANKYQNKYLGFKNNNSTRNKKLL